jgi:hypothetical protein
MGQMLWDQLMEGGDAALLQQCVSGESRIDIVGAEWRGPFIDEAATWLDASVIRSIATSNKCMCIRM